jgi:hypothetical protein
MPTRKSKLRLRFISASPQARVSIGRRVICHRELTQPLICLPDREQMTSSVGVHEHLRQAEAGPSQIAKSFVFIRRLGTTAHFFTFSPTRTHFIDMCSTAARHFVAETDLFNFAAMRSMDVLASIRDLRRASSSGVHLLWLFSGTAIHLAP